MGEEAAVPVQLQEPLPEGDEAGKSESEGESPGQVGILVSSPSPQASAAFSLHPSEVRHVESLKAEQPPAPRPVAALRVPSAAPASAPGKRKPSQQPSGGSASRVGSYATSSMKTPSVATRPSTAVLSVPPPHYALRGSGPGSGPRSPRSRSIMSMSTSMTASRRSSRISTISKQAQMDLGLDLSPGLRQLISRLADTKDVGLIAYLSAVPGEPQRGGRALPPPPPRLQAKQSSMRPIKSIMKMTRNQVRFEPTYRLDPMRPFNVDRVSTLLHTTLETGLSDATYSDQWAGDACRILAAYITNSIKNMDFLRYKIATKVTVLERNYQGARMVLRALWDSDRDSYCYAQVQTTSLVGVAVVFAVYWD